MSPKKTKKDEDSAMAAEIANELGIADYKTLRVSAQNLSNKESDAVKKAGKDAEAEALDGGANVADAKECGQEAMKRETFKWKMAKADKTRAKKDRKDDAADQPNAAADVAAHDEPVRDVVIAFEELDQSHQEYMTALNHAYSTVFDHKVFKDLPTLAALPIQQEDAGDCGVQAPYDNEGCNVALSRERLYRCGGNIGWVDFLRTATPGVPLSLARTQEMTEMTYPKPRPMVNKIQVEGRADQSVPRTSKLFLLSPEEEAHSWLFALERDILSGKSEEVLLEWKKHCRSVCIEFHDVANGIEGLFWHAWNNREQVKITNAVVERTARQRACEVFQMKKRLAKAGLPCNAPDMAKLYTDNATTKEKIDDSFIRTALTVYEKICRVPEIVGVIERLELKYGERSCLNSMSKLVKITEKCDTLAFRILLFAAIEDSITRGQNPNSKFTREFLTGGGGKDTTSHSSISFVQIIQFKWKMRHHMLTVEMPREKLHADDIKQISSATDDYSAYRLLVEDDTDAGDRTWIGAMKHSSVLALRVIQDIVFGQGLQGAVRAVLAQKGATPEDLMNNDVFMARWSIVLKTRQEELIADNIRPADNDGNAAPESVTQLGAADLNLRGSKGVDRCAPDTKEYWECFGAQLVKQYVRLVLEPKAASQLATEIKNSALNKEFKGEAGQSTILLAFDHDNLHENAARPLDRKPMPNQTVISKLLQGVMAGRGGTTNEDGIYIAPEEQDIIIMCDGGGDTVKKAMSAPQFKV